MLLTLYIWLLHNHDFLVSLPWIIKLHILESNLSVKLGWPYSLLDTWLTKLYFSLLLKNTSLISRNRVSCIYLIYLERITLCNSLSSFKLLLPLRHLCCWHTPHFETFFPANGFQEVLLYFTFLTTLLLETYFPLMVLKS